MTIPFFLSNGKAYNHRYFISYLFVIFWFFFFIFFVGQIHFLLIVHFIYQESYQDVLDSYLRTKMDLIDKYTLIARNNIPSFILTGNKMQSRPLKLH